MGRTTAKKDGPPFEPLADDRRRIPSIRYRPWDIALGLFFLAITVGVALWALYAPDSDIRRPTFEPVDWIMESWHDMRGTEFKKWKEGEADRAAKKAKAEGGRFRHVRPEGL